MKLLPSSPLLGHGFVGAALLLQLALLVVLVGPGSFESSYIYTVRPITLEVAEYNQLRGDKRKDERSSERPQKDEQQQLHSFTAQGLGQASTGSGSGII